MYLIWGIIGSFVWKGLQTPQQISTRVASDMAKNALLYDTVSYLIKNGNNF
jgi:hypothetical protein